MYRVFIGSSSEAKHIAEAIAEVVREHNIFEPLPWWQKGVFREGLSFIESLFNIINDVDYAILVAAPTDKTFKRGVKTFAPRDNVIFEYGLFAGRNGRSNVALFRFNNAAIMSDLKGVSLHHIKLAPAQLKKPRNNTKAARDKLVSLVRADVERCLENFLSSPAQTDALLRDLSNRAFNLIKSDQITLLAKASYMRRSRMKLNPLPLSSASEILQKYCRQEPRVVGQRGGKKTEVPIYVDLSSLDNNDMSDLAQTIAWLIKKKLEPDGQASPQARPTRIGIHYRIGKENKVGLRLMSEIADQLDLPQVFVDLNADVKASVKGDLFQEEDVIFLHDFSVTGSTPARCINRLRKQNVNVTHLFSFIVHEAKKEEFNQYCAEVNLNFYPLGCLRYEQDQPVVTWQA